MEIFLIIPTLKQGGAERVMSELANQFVLEQDIKVHLVLLAKSVDFYKVDENVKVHRLGFENRGRINKIFSEVITLFRLRKLFKVYKPDVVLSFMEKYNSFTILASTFLNIRVFVSDRSNPLKKTPKSLELIKRFTYNHATGIIAQTKFAKDILTIKTKNKNIKVIPNPVKKIQSLPKIRRAKIILNVGRLVPEKGQKYLIEAFSKIEGKADWKVVILGDGPLRNELESQVKSLNLENQVELVGAVQNVDEWLVKASIFVFPSISEGFPNALVEAMSAGLPCVSFDCDAGPRDIINNGENGFLVPVNNMQMISNEIQILISDEKLRNQVGVAAQQISNDLNIEKIAKEYLNFITSN